MTPGAREVREDLDYVRGVVARSEGDPGPRAIWFLWGAISAVGFALIDLRPRWVPEFWTAAAPLGFVVSAWLGWRHGRSIGQESRREGVAWMGHWGATLVACFLVVPLAGTGVLEGPGIAMAILLVTALSYTLAGIHLARPLLGIGALIAAGYLAVVFLEGPMWIVVGVVVGIALVATGIVADRPRRPGP